MDPVASAERRRVGRIVRDDRGQAVVEWVKAPKDWARSNLSLADESATAAPSTPLKGYDPYESSSGGTGTFNTRPSQLTRPARTDLRRLSEHIKQMRALKDRESGEK